MVGGEDENEEEEKSDIPYGEEMEVYATWTLAFTVRYEMCFSWDWLSLFHCRTFPLQGHL